MKGYTEYKGCKIEYTYERRKRKTLGITISPDKGVIVAVPMRMNEEQVHAIVKEKAGWIQEKLALMEGMRAGIPRRKYMSGDILPFLGEDYVLALVNCAGGRAFRVKPESGRIEVAVPPGVPEQELKAKVRDALTGWYRKKAADIVGEKLQLFGNRLGVKPSKVVIREQKTRWGSCTCLNTININWKIVLAPHHVVNYLVVHELAHLRIRNHSKHFWRLVESILPDYKETRDWLKANGHKLQL